ncbi:WXG100 family type VII secretion target [Nocardia arthritidis]|uniref:WXG100 family type VII secretion target n=1 Tax=Nocardia arthritidis TaxID=228602 RepID=A0A6G9Y7S6_9NOCA|nr:hypothetical protein [Nocardia arthritidis]QIS09170.1 hypothetical protein F5544_06295 [Nocardia arthritidis]
MVDNYNFSVDPDQVKAQAPKFAEVSSDLRNGLSELQSGLASLGKVWGNDEFGQRFAQNYEHKAEEAASAISSAISMFENLGKAAELIANKTTEVDQGFKDALQKITGKIDGKA